MIEHISTEKIHDLLDGLLSAAEEAEARSHVDECAACRSEVARLGDIVQALRGLPRSGQAPDGLWEGIQGRIEGTRPGEVEDTSVVEFPGAGARRRRFHFSLPQLAAAAVVVSLLSAGTVWMAVSAVATSEPQGSVVRAASLDDVGYAEAVQELEDILLQGRDLLAPETVATIDRSLQTIDEALNEVQAALEADPSSEVLGRMLVNHQRSRLRLLRQAAEAVWARS